MSEISLAHFLSLLLPHLKTYISLSALASLSNSPYIVGKQAGSRLILTFLKINNSYINAFS